MDSKNLPKEEIKAKIQPRIYSADKIKLEDVAPLKTPFSVHIDVCSYCNFKCSFCFQADILGKKEKNFLSKKDFSSLTVRRAFDGREGKKL